MRYRPGNEMARGPYSSARYVAGFRMDESAIGGKTFALATCYGSGWKYVGHIMEGKNEIDIYFNKKTTIQSMEDSINADL